MPAKNTKGLNLSIKADLNWWVKFYALAFRALLFVPYNSDLRNELRATLGVLREILERADSSFMSKTFFTGKNK